MLLTISCKIGKKQEKEVKKQDTKEIVKELPNTFPLKELALHPEGIVYSDATKKTYVGSYFKGKIISVDLDGKMSNFVIDDNLVAVVGMEVDNKNNRPF